MEENKKEEKFKFVKNVTNNKKKIILTSIIIIVAFILITLYCTIFALLNINNTKIISGVKINNIDISNLTQEEAKEKVQKLIDEKKKENIKLQKDDFENDLSVEQLEVNYEVDSAIEQAYNIGRSNNIIKNNFEIMKCKNKEKNIELNLQYNEENLKNIITEINGSIPGAGKETSYFIEDKNLIITKGTKGNVINEDELKEVVKQDLSKIEEKEQTIEIPVQEKEPDAIDIEKIYNEIHTEAKDAY